MGVVKYWYFWSFNFQRWFGQHFPPAALIFRDDINWYSWFVQNLIEKTIKNFQAKPFEYSFNIKIILDKPVALPNKAKWGDSGLPNSGIGWKDRNRENRKNRKLEYQDSWILGITGKFKRRHKRDFEQGHLFQRVFRMFAGFLAWSKISIDFNGITGNLSKFICFNRFSLRFMGF